MQVPACSPNRDLTLLYPPTLRGNRKSTGTQQKEEIKATRNEHQKEQSARNPETSIQQNNTESWGKTRMSNYAHPIFWENSQPEYSKLILFLSILRSSSSKNMSLTLILKWLFSGFSLQGQKEDGDNKTEKILFETKANRTALVSLPNRRAKQAYSFQTCGNSLEYKWEVRILAISRWLKKKNFPCL